MANHLISIRAAEIQYLGDSIGSDLTLVIDVGGERHSLNKRMVPGQSSTLNVEIGQFWTASASLSLSGVVQIIERDPVYTESGQTPVNWGVDAQDEGLQESEHRIEVTESGRHTGSARALFLVTLQARAVVSTRYVPETSDGWLNVIPKNTRDAISLPEGLQVEINQVTNGREHFRINEGSHRGQEASVKLNSDGTSRLSLKDTRTTGAKLAYSISRKTLKVAGKIYTAIDDPSTPWKKGLYDVEIPDAPHKGGRYYPEAKRARTWFLVGHRGDRYLHTGRASLGCITVLERDRWDELCAKLVVARKGDGISIGTLEVVD